LFGERRSLDGKRWSVRLEAPDSKGATVSMGNFGFTGPEIGDNALDNRLGASGIGPRRALLRRSPGPSTDQRATELQRIAKGA
jgi:hypothetical protein